MQAPQPAASRLGLAQKHQSRLPLAPSHSAVGRSLRGRPAGVFGGRSHLSGLAPAPHVATLPHQQRPPPLHHQQQQHSPQAQQQQHSRTPYHQQQQAGALQQRRPRGAVAARAKKDDEDDDEEKKDWKFGRNEGPMPWPWKLCCAILYMLPWVDVTEKTVYFIERFPAFHWTEYFTEPFEHWFYIHEWAPLIIFFGTYLGIVRNKRIPHVARYHIMMGIMLDIVAMILIVVEENLPFGVLWTPWSDLFYALMFWFVFLLVMYCLFFCFMGWYCEIPLISEGVYIQIEQAESMGAS